MYIDKLRVCKFEIDDESKKKNLLMKNHLMNEDSMHVRKLSALLESLAESWNCTYDDMQVQVRFVPQGTGMDDQ